MAFQWKPGQGPSFLAIERMRDHFPKPSHPMGEAWFNTSRRVFYDELSEKPINEISIDELQRYLFEISSGTSSFGHREEWDQWFKYLLPDLILRSHETYAFSTLVETLVTTFMSVFWMGLDGEYDGFSEDVHDSLSICLMKPEYWANWQDSTMASPERAVFLAWGNEKGLLEPAGWNAGKASGPFSAMMFFCLKYLPTGEIASWVDSLTRIADPYWRGALAVWLVGACDLFTIPVPVPSALERTSPDLRWHDSHVLGSRFGTVDAEEPPDKAFNDNKDFLNSKNVAVFLTEIVNRLTPETVLNWVDSFSTDPQLELSLLYIPDALFDRFSSYSRLANN